MRPWSTFLVMALTFVRAANADSDLDSVIEADRAFASASVERGQRSAFEQFLARDAIVFRPGAVNGQEWLSGHEPATGRLEWQPVAAAISCDSRMAVTSGPWTYADMDGRQTAAGYYLSLWRRDENGDWLIVLDHGIDIPAGTAAVSSMVAARFAQAWPDTRDRKCGKGDSEELERAERELNSEVKSHGWVGALQSMDPGNVLAYRDGSSPSVGIPTPDTVAAARGVARSQFVQADTGSDMGYSFGELLDGKGEDARAAAVYVRLWRRAPRGWQVVLDMLTRLPDR